MKPISTGIRVGGIYKLNVTSAPQQALTSTSMTIVNMWHQRFRHINLHDLFLLEKQGMVNGLLVLKDPHIDYEGCALAKMHRDEFPSSLNRKKRDILELVHTDICGPMQTRSLGGAYYFLLFIDDCTRYTWVYFPRNKSHTFEYFIEFRSMIAKRIGKVIRILCLDRGGEYKL